MRQYVGSEYLQHCGETFVIDCKSTVKIRARYYYEGHFIGYNKTLIVRIDDVLKGLIKNPEQKNQYGFLCDISITLNLKRIYFIWKDLEKRCYHQSESSYSHYGALGVTVDDEFKTFSKFKDWYLSQPDWNKNFEIDKDCLSNLKNIPKIYSSTTCILIPNSINTFLSTLGKGIYITKFDKYCVRLRRRFIRLNKNFKSLEEAIKFKKEWDRQYLETLIGCYNINAETVTYLREYVKIFKYGSDFPRSSK